MFGELSAVELQFSSIMRLWRMSHKNHRIRRSLSITQVRSYEYSYIILQSKWWCSLISYITVILCASLFWAKCLYLYMQSKAKLMEVVASDVYERRTYVIKHICMRSIYPTVIPKAAQKFGIRNRSLKNPVKWTPRSAHLFHFSSFRNSLTAASFAEEQSLLNTTAQVKAASSLFLLCQVLCFLY